MKIDNEKVIVTAWHHLPWTIKLFLFEVHIKLHFWIFSRLPLISLISRDALGKLALNYHKPETLELGVEFIDNSYGKNSNLYNIWLKDFDNIKEYN